MEQTWRWFGPDDVIRLNHIRQTGATGIVTALHQIPYGVVWSVEEIEERKAMIAADPSLGLRWSVVESLPIHESIKIGEGDLTPLFDNYRQSLRNLAACGVTTVCYNFMPILDWTRTDLAAPVPGGGTSLRFNAHEHAAFDVFMLERPGAEDDHSPEVLARARAWFDKASEDDKKKLLANIMAGLPGAFDRYDIPGLRKMLARYKDMSHGALRETLARFLREVIPTAEEVGIRMCIHPDDPPRPLMGLPRIVSNEDDLDFIVNVIDSEANGITFCTGSLGAGAKNDVPAMIKRFAPKVTFAHLRNVKKDPDGSFQEAEHLGGDVDMVSVVTTLLEEQKRRKDTGNPNWRIPFRPDHGHELLDDVGKKTHPGYPAIGRLRGLAEIRGVMTAVASMRQLPV
ncbi:mannonate dehydratase [Azospirillum sp. YIM DDC1]|uniref:Mannonate dehydratase n=1 Tax=Azospirillum aestuarii TaxID=2802052 RepID=A0ABS1I8W0_9PROT|nr:mannonate dehydratase [Azospirillum aestuarii]MBK3778207.1 mannonate dehydratase [Azospirillum brasilense]MBK4723485.1 mannonate dehydratase [Azospirillum aestuarii]TWA77521.1 D-mannonate dehydratase [Azospirillum brasilense]